MPDSLDPDKLRFQRAGTPVVTHPLADKWAVSVIACVGCGAMEALRA